MILRLFEQEVQISATKTGSLVCATLKNHSTVREAEGHDIGVSFFLGTSFFGQAKKKCLAAKRRNQNPKNSEYASFLKHWFSLVPFKYKAINHLINRIMAL